MDLLWRELCSLSCVSPGEAADVAAFRRAAPDVLIHAGLLRRQRSGAVAEMLSAAAALPSCRRPLRALLSVVDGGDVVSPSCFAAAHASLAASVLPRVQAVRLGVVLALAWPDAVERAVLEVWFDAVPAVGEVAAAVSETMSSPSGVSCFSCTASSCDLPPAVRAACWARSALTGEYLAGSGEHCGSFRP